MSWSDKEIDKLFQESADAKSFEYNNEYWNEMEALLPTSAGKDLLWIFTSIAFVGLLLTAGVVGENRMIAMTKESVSLITENTMSVIETEAIDSNSEMNKLDINSGVTNESGTVGTINETVMNSKTASYKMFDETNDILHNPKLDDLTSHPFLVATVNEEGQTEIDSELSSTSITEKLNTSNVIDKYGVIGDLSLLPIKRVIGTNISMELQLTGLPLISPHKPIQTRFYVAALGGVSQSMITPSDKVSTSFGAGLGVQLRKGSFLFNLGLNGVVGVHNDIVLSRESKVYGFGSTSYRYELKYSNVYSLEGDLTLGYQFKNSIFSFGIRPSYGTGTKVSMRMQENEGDFNKENFFGYFDGINRFGVKPMVGYSYKFGSGLSLGLNIGVQLMPLLNDEYINGVSNRFPIDGQLILKKTLNFKK